jgi:hypothetical protein
MQDELINLVVISPKGHQILYNAIRGICHQAPLFLQFRSI